MADDNTFESDWDRLPDQVVDERIKEIWRKSQLKELHPSNIENIDAALYEWLNNKMDLHTISNKGAKKVPVIWAGAERTLQSKRDPEERRQDGALIYPLITLERTAISKSLTRKGIYYGDIPPENDYRKGSIKISRRINQDKTQNFANADARRFEGETSAPVKKGIINFKTRKKNNKIVFETLTVPMIVYVDIQYSINIRTEYQQQMNELIQPFLVYTGGVNYFVLERNDHRYECFVQEAYTGENNLNSMGDEARNFETNINIKTLGYVFGSGNNQETPKVTKRENAVEFKMPRERVVVRQSQEYNDITRSKYKI